MDYTAGNWNKQEWRVMRKGISATAFGTEGATVGISKFEPGHEVRPHSHHYEQIAIILEGEGDFTVGDTTYRMTAGCYVVIPPNVEHYLKVKVPTVNLDVWTPRRVEYVRPSAGAEIV